MTEAKKCAHSSCSCIAPEGSKYCCQMCEDSKDVVDITCQCQHAGCAAEALKN